MTRAPSSSVGLGVRPGRRAGPTPYARAVLDVVDRIPPGRVLTYGDVAELTGWGAPRAVGTVMARHGHELPWWRVVRADGSLAEGLLARARLHWAEEGTPLRPGGDAVDLARARWDAADADPGAQPAPW